MPSQKTWSGDDGSTEYLGKGRVAKSSLRIQCLGNLDETSATIGLVKSFCEEALTRQKLETVQRALYRLMAAAAASPENTAKFPGILEEDILWLEAEVHTLETSIHTPQDFILPGGTRFSAALDLARTVTRRAERSLVELFQSGEYKQHNGLKYLNRLSTWIYYLEIAELSANSRMDKSIAKLK